MNFLDLEEALIQRNALGTVQLINKNLRFAPGYAIALIKGSNAYYLCRGELKSEQGSPVNLTSNFYISSLSKVFTALMILQLAEKKVIDLTEPIVKYLPESMPVRNTLQRITGEQLLTHTSGLPMYFPDFCQRNNEDLHKHAVQILSLGQQVCPAGTLFNYSSVNYNLLGYLIERVAKTPFIRYAQEHLLCPLKLENTSYDIEMRDNQCSGHDWKNFRFVPSPKMKNRFSYAPSTQMQSSIKDLAKIVQYILSIPKPIEDVTGRSNLSKIYRPYVDMFTSRGDFYGFGFSFKKDAYAMVHEGIGQGFYSKMYIRPDWNCGVVLLASSQLYGCYSRITHQLLQLFGSENRDNNPTAIDNSLHYTCGRPGRFAEKYTSVEGTPSVIQIRKTKEGLILTYYSIVEKKEYADIPIQEKAGKYSAIINQERKKIGFYTEEEQVTRVVIDITMYLKEETKMEAV